MQTLMLAIGGWMLIVCLSALIAAHAHRRAD